METDLLISWGASVRKLPKGRMIFEQGDEARYYYKVESGEVKMFNLNDEGKEFTQGIFCTGESFGEPPLLIGEPYPASAMTTQPSVIIRLPKERFWQILDEYRSLERELLLKLGRRIYQKAHTTTMIVGCSPKQRILLFLENFKKKKTKTKEKEKILIPYTRQQIANFTGLRVETVIRTLQALNQEEKVRIAERKLYY